MNSAVIGTPPEDKRGDDSWMCIHKRFIVEAQEQEPEVLFIGDSLITFGSQTDIWEKFFAPLHCLSFGIAEDKTQNVLWRIENGEIGSTNPRVIVLSVGSNNIEHSKDEILEGISACAKAVFQKKPNVTLVVLKLLPCGQKPNPMRSKLMEVNAMLEEAMAKFPSTQVVDIDTGFVQLDGTISHHDMYDYRNLTKSAYGKSFEILADLLQQIMFENINLDNILPLE